MLSFFIITIGLLKMSHKIHHNIEIHYNSLHIFNSLHLAQKYA